MKAVRLHGVGSLAVASVPLPSLAAGEVQLRVLAAGICGSDLHNYRSGKWIARLPVTPGHELCGEVLAVAADVSDFSPGDVVVADSRVFCRACPACQRGAFNLCDKLGFVGEVCDGGFAEQTVLPASGLLRVPAGVPPQVAVLSEPLGVALRVVNLLAAPPGASVRVAGGGTIGGLVALLLHHVAHCRVQLAEPNAARRELLAGIVPLADDGGYDFAVEATGIGPVLEGLIDGINGGGRVVLVGLFHHPLSLDFNKLVEREITVTGSSVFRDEQAQALALLPELQAALSQLSAPAIGLDAVPEAYQQLLAGKSGYLKTVVTP